MTDPNEDVTNAILVAERSGLQSDWLAVLTCEARIAMVEPLSSVEGQIARRGTVLAALSAGMPELAVILAKGWLREPNGWVVKDQAGYVSSLLKLLDESKRACGTPDEAAPAAGPGREQPADKCERSEHEQPIARPERRRRRGRQP